MSIHCIYHGNCPDGFTAAWVLRNELPVAQFTAAAYNEPPPDVTDQFVYIVDFSYPADVLAEMAEQANEIIVLDHHQSAQKDLEGFERPNVEIVFDMERSGAGITWDYLRGPHPRPALVNYVEDRDLWRFALPHSKDIAPLFMGTEQTWANWDRLDRLMGMYLMDAVDQGRAMRQMREKIIADIAATARPMQIGGHMVPVAPSPYALGSDVAGELCDGYSFAAYYVDLPECRQFGLRSAPDGMDVSLIAKEYGGGGHKHAAGFKVDWGHGLTIEETP